MWNEIGVNLGPRDSLTRGPDSLNEVGWVECKCKIVRSLVFARKSMHQSNAGGVGGTGSEARREVSHRWRVLGAGEWALGGGHRRPPASVYPLRRYPVIFVRTTYDE